MPVTSEISWSVHIHWDNQGWIKSKNTKSQTFDTSFRFCYKYKSKNLIIYELTYFCGLFPEINCCKRTAKLNLFLSTIWCITSKLIKHHFKFDLEVMTDTPIWSIQFNLWYLLYIFVKIKICTINMLTILSCNVRNTFSKVTILRYA